MLALVAAVLLPSAAHAALPEPWRSLLRQPVESAVWVGDGILHATAAAQRSLASALSILTDTLGAAIYTAFFPQPQAPRPIVRLAATHRTDDQQPDEDQPLFQEQQEPGPPQQEPPTQPTPPPIIITANTKNLEEQLSSLQQAYQALVLAFLTSKEDTDKLRDELRRELAERPVYQTYGSAATYIPPLNTPGWTQRIDNLGGVTITQAVIEGASVIRDTTLENITITNTTGTTSASLTTLTVSATTTLASQTPNAILYLTPSRTITTSPLFSFNGTNLTLGTSTPLNNATLTLNGSLALQDLTTLPTTTTNLLYATGGTLYWAGNPLASSSIGYWTTDGTNV